MADSGQPLQRKALFRVSSKYFVALSAVVTLSGCAAGTSWDDDRPSLNPLQSVTKDSQSPKKSAQPQQPAETPNAGPIADSPVSASAGLPSPGDSSDSQRGFSAVLPAGYPEFVPEAVDRKRLVRTQRYTSSAKKGLLGITVETWPPNLAYLLPDEMLQDSANTVYRNMGAKVVQTKRVQYKGCPAQEDRLVVEGKAVGRRLSVVSKPHLYSAMMLGQKMEDVNSKEANKFFSTLSFDTGTTATGGKLVSKEFFLARIPPSFVNEEKGVKQVGSQFGDLDSLSYGYQHKSSDFSIYFARDDFSHANPKTVVASDLVGDLKPLDAKKISDRKLLDLRIESAMRGAEGEITSKSDFLYKGKYQASNVFFKSNNEVLKGRMLVVVKRPYVYRVVILAMNGQEPVNPIANELVDSVDLKI